jgi:hypothetical protein
MPDLKQALRDFITTANSGRYTTEEELMSKFPELQGYDIQVLRDFVTTANSGRYTDEETLFSKFPEFKFDQQQPTQQQPIVKKKDDMESDWLFWDGSSESEPSKTEPEAGLFSRLAQKALGIKQPQQEQVEPKKRPETVEEASRTWGSKVKKEQPLSEPLSEYMQVYGPKKGEGVLAPQKPLDFLGRMTPEMVKEATPKFLEDGLNALTPGQFWQFGPDGAKETFEYYFKDAGFRFETEGNNVKAISPSGEIYEYNTKRAAYPNNIMIDEFKNFIRESAFKNPEIADKAYLYEKENKKFKTKEEINNEVKSINAQEEQFNGDYKKFLNLKRDIDEIEADLKRWRDFGEQNTPKYIQTEAYLNERKKELQDYAGTMDSKAKVLEAQQTQLDKAVGKYTEFQATQGTFGGTLYRAIAETSSNIFSQFLRTAISKTADTMPLSSVIGEEAYQDALNKKLKEKGYGDDKVVPIEILKEAKAEVEAEIGAEARNDFKVAARTGKYKGEQLNNVLTINDVRESLKDVLTAPISTTSEYKQKREEEGGFIERGVIGLAGSLPAMIGGKYVRYMNMFMMTTDAVMQEMDNNPNFAGISENEKELVALPIGVVGAALEEIGLRGLIKGSSLTTNIVRTVIGRVPANATAATIRKTTFDVVAEMGIRGGLALTGATLAEAETGAAQQINEYFVKDIYNSMREKKMFDNPAFLSGQYLYDVYDAARTEAVGGFVMGVPYSVSAAYKKDGFQALDDATFKIFEDLAKDNDSRKFFVTSLKNKINLGEVTPNQGKQMLEAYDQASGMIGSVPDEITDPQSRKIAMDLISERKKLEGKKEKYDDALAKPIQDKINQINEQLTQLTQDAIQKQAAGEVSLQPETEPGKEMEAGGTEAGSQAAPKQGVLSPEEKEKLTQNRRVDLFPEESEFADVIGGSGRNSSLSDYNEVNGVGIASYTNPDNGLVDVVMSGTSDNDYVGYVRVYENGKPTNRWTSKMSNESGNKENFKTMISEVQARLPENHEYTEKTNISIDGVRVYSNQLNRGYEVLTDANGNPVTNTVTLNAASVEGLQQAATQEEKQSLYDNMTVTTREQFNALRDKITALMPNTRVLWNQANNTVQIQLPVLVQSKKAATTEQVGIEQAEGLGTQLETVAKEEKTPTEVTPAEQFTEQDRSRKAELEEAMRKADKRRKNITVGETTMPKSEAKAELDALVQKEQATQQPPAVEVAPAEVTLTEEVVERTPEQEADLLEELLTGKKKEPVAVEPTSKEAIAKRLRGKKNKGLMSSIDFGISQALYNGALEFMASQVEKGTKLGNAIENTIKWIDERMQGKSWDKDGFTKYANTTFEEVATKKKAKDILDVYPKGSVVGIADLASESGDTIISNVLSKMKDVFNKVKISGRRPTEGAAFYNYNTKEIDVNKNSPHWDEVEGDQIASALSHEFAHHLIDGHPERETIETDLQEIKDDLIANKPELTESQKKAYEFMTSKNNSPQEILTYAVSDPDIRPILTKYKDKLNNISNKLFGEDVISGIFEEQKTKKDEIQSQRTRDGRGRTESRAIAPLEGAPSVPGFSGPDPQLTAVAEEYAKENGIPYKRQGEYVKVDEDRAKRIAQAYEEMKHDPQNPKVKEAYENLIKQTIAQYEALVKAGYKFWFIDTNIPSNLEYAQSPFNAMRDVRSNKQMGVFPTTDGFGSSDIDVSDNPMMAETKFKWPVGGMDGELKPVLANDLFRAVHDAFGHGLEGAGFRARGEENAWQAHIRLFTGSAVGAITSETRGQNSWLNFGPHGEKNRTANTDETIFADQKTGLMPEWTWKEGVAADMETTAEAKEESPALANVEATAKALEGADIDSLFEKTKNKKYFRGQPTENIPQKDIFISPNEIVGRMYTKGKGILKKLALTASNLFNIDTKVTKDFNDKLIEAWKGAIKEKILIPKEILNGVHIGGTYSQTLKEEPQFRRALEAMGYDGLLNNFSHLNLPSNRQEIIVFDKSNLSEINSNLISEAYHKAKADGSNPELVQAVEEALGKPKGKKLSDTIRGLEIKGPGGLQSNLFGIPIAIWNAAVKTTAAAIDANVAVAEALQRGAAKIKNWIKENDPFNKLTDERINNKVLRETFAGAVKIARDNNVSEEGIKTYLKRKGLTDEQIEVVVKKRESKPATTQAEVKEKTTAKKVDVSDIKELEQIVKLQEDAINAGKTSVTEAVKEFIRLFNKSKVITKLTRSDLNKIINLMAKVSDYKSLQTATGKMFDIILKSNPDLIEVSKTKLAEEFKKKVNAGIRQGKKDLNTKRKELTAAIKEMKKKGSISVRQAKALINRVNAVNLDNPVMVERLLDYAEKVFNDAAYAEKLSQANKLQSQIKQLSKNNEKFGNLTAFAAEFAKIDPALVEDIDEYIEMASNVKEGVQGSKVVGEKVIPADMVDVGKAMEYVNKTMKAQEETIRLKTAERLQELIGVDVSDLSMAKLQELMELVKAEALAEGEQKDKLSDKINEIFGTNKNKEKSIRDGIQRMFDTYSTIIKDMFETGIDPFSDPDNPTTVEFKDSDKKIVEEFMDMDLSLLDKKEALRAADALNNFLTNKSTAGMLATLGDYNGRKNVKEVVKEGKKAKQIKMYWSPVLGRTYFQQIASIPLFFERLFKSYKTGRYIREMMGLNSMTNHKAEAIDAGNRIINKYLLEFSNKTPNKKSFQDLYNIIERDMIGSLGKTIVGDAKQVEAEFNRRKKLIEQSIEILEESGTKKELELAKTMKEVYNKIAKDAKNIEEVKAKADKTNVAAVQFWIDTWAKLYDQFADVALNVYNRVLDKNVNFVPDRFGFVEGAEKKSKDGNGFDSVFFTNSNSDYFYKKEAGSLMKSTPPQSLLDEDGNSRGMYVDMSFDTKNANALMDALIDIKTAADIRQVQAFVNDPGFKDIFPFAKDRTATKERIALLIRNFRNKRAITDRSLKDMAKRMDRIAAIGTSLLLAGPTQAISQTIPVAINTIINSGGKLNLSNINNKDVNNFINNSGMGIANRGSDAVTELETLNQKLEVASKTKAGAVVQYIENLNRKYLKLYLSNFDVFIARASWITYYEKGLRKQGIKGKVDYSTHKMNKEAAQYAQDMIDRQQNISDKDLAGQLYQSDNPWKQFIVKIIMPLATFRMNQTTRFSNDLAIFSSKTASTEEKKEAAISIGGFAAEMATFRAIKLYIGYSVFYSLAQMIRGEEDDEEEKQKTWDNMKRGAATSVVSDVFSPIPMTDVPTKILFAGVLDQLQNIAGIGEDDKFNIFTESKSSFTSDWGLLGVGVDKMIKLGEKVELARTGKFKDDFGNEKTISESDRALLSNPLYIGINVATVLGLNPLAPETDNVMNRITKMAKKNAMSNEQLKEAKELGIEGKKELMQVKAEKKANKEEAYGGYKTLEEFEEKEPEKFDEYSAPGGKLDKYREQERKEDEEKNKDQPFRGLSEKKFKELYPEEWRKYYGPGTAYFRKQNSPAMLQKKAQEKMREAQREQKRKMAEVKRKQQEAIRKASGK